MHLSDGPVFASTSSSCRLARRLCFAVYTAGHAFSCTYKPLLERLGLTYPQYLVLLVFWEEDNRAVKEIGQRRSLDSRAPTPMSKWMEEPGLLRRIRDLADERQVCITLTANGRELEAQAASIMDRLVCVIAQPDTDLLALTNDMVAVREAFLPRDET